MISSNLAPTAATFSSPGLSGLSTTGAAISATNRRLARMARRCATISQISQKMTSSAMMTRRTISDAKGSDCPT